MNTRIVMFALLGVLMVSGCALNRKETASELIIAQTPAATSPTTAVSVTDTPTSTPTAMPTNVPPTATEAVVASEPDAAVAVVVDAVDEASFVLPNCDIRMGHWPIHTVQPGDTLTRIAATYNTTVDVLAQENCLADPNHIYVGQRLHVPFTEVPDIPVEPPPEIPLYDSGPQPPHVCVVVPDGEQANIWGAGATGPDPAAILVGTVLFVRRADNAYIVELQPGIEGWVSATEAHVEGTSCPDVDVPNAPDTPVPTPDESEPLPVFTNEGEPSENRCSVVRDPGIDSVFIYFGPADAFAPIGILGNWLPFVDQHSGGYEVRLPGRDHTGWIAADDASLIGNDCPDA